MKTAFTIFVVCLGISTGTVGNGLLYGIVLYEKYGVDSMRRTIVNMLWSQLCLTYILSNTFGLPFAIYGYCLNDITGGIGYTSATWTIFLFDVTDVMCGFILAEIGFFKCLYIKKWSRMAHLDDYFFASFLGLMNTMIVVIISSISVGMGEVETRESFEGLVVNPRLRSVCNINITKSQINVEVVENVLYWNSFVPFIVLISFIAGSCGFVLLQKMKFKTQSAPASVVVNLNIDNGDDQNQTNNDSPSNEPVAPAYNHGFNLNPNIGKDGKNKSILGQCGTVIACLLMGVTLLPFMVVEVFGADLDSEWHKLFFLLPNVAPTFLIPALFYVTNPKSLTIIKEVILDMF